MLGSYTVKIKITLLLALVILGQPKLHAQWFFDSTACFSNAFGLELTTSSRSLFACDTLTLSTAHISGKPIIYWNNSVTGPTAFINMPGRYQAYAMDSKGCWDTTRSVEVTLHYNTPYTYSNNFSTTFCTGQELRITAVSLFPGRWNTQDTNREIAVRKGGTYYFVAKSDSGCIDTSTVLDLTEINVAKPDIKASGNTTFCLGDTVYLSTTSKARIAWYPSGFGSKVRIEYSGIQYAIATDSASGRGTAHPSEGTSGPGHDLEGGSAGQDGGVDAGALDQGVPQGEKPIPDAPGDVREDVAVGLQPRVGAAELVAPAVEHGARHVPQPVRDGVLQGRHLGVPGLTHQRHAGGKRGEAAV